MALTVGGVALAWLLLGSRGEESAITQLPRTAVPQGQPNGRPATADARLTASWGASGRRQPALVTRWQHAGRAVIVGRLTTRAGRPIADASISVRAADPSTPDQGSRTVGQVRTDRQGRFATGVALDRGAPRKVLTFSYLAESDDKVAAASARASLDVVGAISAQTSIRRTRRRTSIPLEGTGPGGATVQVWVRPPGTREWRISSIARATGRGRWEASLYVPSYAARGIYRVRARVLGDNRRGFLSAHSRETIVRVR